MKKNIKKMITNLKANKVKVITISIAVIVLVAIGIGINIANQSGNLKMTEQIKY